MNIFMIMSPFRSGPSAKKKKIGLKRFFNDLTNLIMIIVLLLLTSCSEINTTNTNEVFRYWDGKNPPPDIQLLQGQYWQSEHWTAEYIVYLKFKSTEEWWNKFLKKNELSTDKNNWTLPGDAPDWFRPSNNSVRFGTIDDFDQGSRYFRDPITQVCYIYEIQL
jgi:hypothetical protein